MSINSFKGTTLVKEIAESSRRLRRKQKKNSRKQNYFAEVDSGIKKLDQLADFAGNRDNRKHLPDDIHATVIHDFLYLQRRNYQIHKKRSWLQEYRQLWRQELPLLIFCAIVFLASILIGWTIAVSSPELVPVLISQPIIEHVLEHRSWFDSIQESPIRDGLRIAYNNIGVSINCMLASALLGIGGLVFLVINGLFFGAMLGFCYENDFHRPLIQFVLSHGPLELSVIVAAAFAGLLFGRSFYMRPYSKFGQRMRDGAHNSLIISRGILPWLLIAALFEVFVSPWNYLSVPLKSIAGLLLALIFWGWNFAPVRQNGIDAFDHKSSLPRSSSKALEL